MAEVSRTYSYWPAETSEPIVETNVGSILRDAADRVPDRLALVEGVPAAGDRRRWTYGELLVEAERVARALLARFAPGERVAIWANSIPEWVLLEYGAALAGLTLVTVNPAYRAREVEYVLRQSRAHGIFLLPEYRANPMADILDGMRRELPELREVVLFSEWGAFRESGSPTERLPEVRSDAPAQIQYTSGTTGFPKGAVLHHRGVTNTARLMATCWGADSPDVWINPLPMFHIGGCVIGTLVPVSSLGTQVLMPSFEAGLALELVESERCTVLFGVPTMLIALFEHPQFSTRDLSSVRFAVSGGATVPPELVRQIETRLRRPFSIIFGQTGASGVLTMTRLRDRPEDRATSLGQPLPQVEVKIVDPATQAMVAPGVVGELCARGYQVMDGYFDNPEGSAAAIDKDGWLHTGDLCSMDARGYCRVEGRLKDMIIRGGENIYPREIEQLLFSHPSVADAAVIGVPDPKWGEQVAAFVRPAAGQTPTADELFAFCRQHLAPHKTPRFWEFVNEFPITPSGKIQKFVLRERFVSRARHAAMTERIPASSAIP
jgi:fatty-acyl-CoA synthase